jgi:hypothetical protein
MKEQHTEKRPFTLRLPPAIHEAVEREAERERRSLNAMIAVAVEDWIERRRSAVGREAAV